MDDFTKLFESFEIAIWGIRGIASLGVIGVIMVLLHNVYGINFKFTHIELQFQKMRKRILQTTGISHFERICSVTVSNLAIDFANLTNDGNKWSGTKINNFRINDAIFLGMNKVDKKVAKILSSKWTTSQNDFESHFRKEEKTKMDSMGFRIFDIPKTIQQLYQNYKLIKEISIRYEITFSQALSWFYNNTFCNVPELYESEAQLKVYIESRDWYSANLLQYRITDSITRVLMQKNMPPEIDENWNRRTYEN